MKKDLLEEQLNEDDIRNRRNIILGVTKLVVLAGFMSTLAYQHFSWKKENPYYNKSISTTTTASDNELSNDELISKKLEEDVFVAPDGSLWKSKEDYDEYIDVYNEYIAQQKKQTPSEKTTYETGIYNPNYTYEEYRYQMDKKIQKAIEYEKKGYYIDKTDYSIWVSKEEHDEYYKYSGIETSSNMQNQKK